MTKRRTLPVLLVAATFAVVVPLAASRSGGGAGQIPPGPPATPIPTSPCSGCGPTPGTAIVKDFAWAYPLHFCPPGTTYGPEGSAVYAMVYGNGGASAGPVQFFGQINGILRTLNTLQPGERAVEFPAIAVPQGVSFELEMWATVAGTGPNGPRVQWGNGTDSRTDTLVCDCDQPNAPGPPPANLTPSTAPGATAPLIPPSR